MTAPHTRYARLLLISLIATVADIVGHMLGPQLAYEHASAIFKQQALFLPLISLLLFSVMLTLAILFTRVQSRLPGSGVAKGLRFALPFGLLFLFGVVELCLLQGSSLAQELYTGAVDGGAVVLLGVLLGRFLGTTDGRSLRSHETEPAAVAVVAVVWLGVRYLGYALGLESAYITKPVETLLWTMGAGTWIGVLVVTLRPAFSNGSRWRHAGYLGGVYFGLVWALVNAAGPLFVQVSVLGIAIRVLVDVAAVSLGALLSELLFAPRTSVPERQA